MSRNEQLRSDIVRLTLLMGLCTAIGVYLILTTAVIARDGVFYVEQAKLLGQDPAGVCRRYPPGYPFLLRTGHQIASLFVSEDSSTLWAGSSRAITLLCRVLALIPLYFLGKRLVGATHSFWALLVLILLPYPAFYGSDILREWPYVLFLSAGLLLLYWGLTSGRLCAFALAGLSAGLGYLIRPECAQLLVYALVGLVVAGRASCEAAAPTAISRRFVAGLVMVGAFVVSIGSYACASGGILPHQLRSSAVNQPPVISAVGARAATVEPLEFEVRAGELLELPIQADDADHDPMSFSLARIAPTSRPVYLFRSPTSGSQFCTISEGEKDLLIAHHPDDWICEGIGWYAYTRADARPGLQPAYRFWSPTRQQHFFTMSESEKDDILTRWTGDSWTCEGTVFYAFGREDHPSDAIAVCRSGSRERGYSWAMAPSVGPDAQTDTVAWYAYPAGAPPAGAAIEDGVFRWRPDPSQQGEHWMNIIVTDEKLPSCQLVTIRVVAAGAIGRDMPDEERTRTYASAGTIPSVWTQLLSAGATVLRSPTLRDLAKATSYVADGVTEDLMVILTVPWIVGLCIYFRGRAGTLEKSLILAVVIVNLGLMLGRNVWVELSSDRRYAVPMISLTIFFLPMGLDVLSTALSRVRALRAKTPSFWFAVLLVGSIVLCMPKLLLTPLRSEKIGLRKAGEWLRQNAPPDSVVAEPDRRISFYAQRQGLYYERYPDSRRTDYIAAISRGDQTQILAGWTQVFSTALEPGDDRSVIVYRTDRGKQ